MADDTNFIELLGKSMSEYPDLPDLPSGKYFFGKIISMNAALSTQKKTPYYHFDIRITDPGKDVSEGDLAPLANAGMTLADYNNCGADFYLTPKSMVMFRRFLTSLGFSENVTFIEALSLDPSTGNPTPESIEKVRGLDVMFKIPAPGDNGRVYLPNVEACIGVKR